MPQLNRQKVPSDVGVIRQAGTASNPSGETYYPAPNPLLQALADALGRTSPPQTPAGDIRPLTITAPPPIPASVPVSAPVAQPVTTPTKQDTASQEPSKFMQFLKTLGLPLASTALGLAVPQTLAGAAGFNTGYAEGREKALDRQSKKELYDKMINVGTFDPDTGEFNITGKVPKGTQIRNLTSEEKLNFFESMLGKLETPQTQTGTAVKQAESQTKEVQGNVPAGATHYSPSTKKYYNAQGQEL